jgi:peptidoglycan hydrolase-like protein with peptidoglycan-binding domain
VRRSLAIGVLALAFAGAADAATTLSIAPGTARYGANATFSGAVTPAAGGVSVQIVSSATGQPIGSTTTAADGTFNVALAVSRGGQYTAVASTGTSPAASLQMIPSLVAKIHGKRVIGGKLTLRGRLRPTAAKGHLRLRVHGQTRNVRVGAEGWFRTSFPSDLAGRTKWSLRLNPAAGYKAVHRKGAPHLRGPRLGFGSRGVAVRLLEKRLRDLHYTLMGVDGYYGTDTFQAVMAFQKIRGLARTGRVDAGFWRLLSRAGIPKAFVPRGTHIEISKTKQVMFEVRNGKVVRVAHVSTGATGNTPVGRFTVYSLVPGYNAKGMYYSLFFHGNFAIHGYHSVPAYQASHGCVRTPIWYARGFYERWGHIGTSVMIFA